MANDKRMKGGVTPKDHLLHPHDQAQRRQGRHQGARKLDHLEYQTGQSGFSESGQ
jgi:hypothetical protein